MTAPELRPDGAALDPAPAGARGELALPHGARRIYRVVMPLVERFRRGEGALLVVNAAIVVSRGLGALESALALLISFVVLASLYSYNDLHDAEEDLRNPKKNPRLVAAFLEGRREFARFLLGLQGVAAGLAWAGLGGLAAAAVLAVCAVNALYSNHLKGVPLADVAIVGLWGAFYSGIVAADWRICVLVGVMTAICHVYQILGDREVDELNRVRTTAVLSVPVTTTVLAGLCAILFVALLPSLGVWSLSALAPLGLDLALGGTAAAWMLSRLYFGLTLVAVLGGVLGSP